MSLIDYISIIPSLLVFLGIISNQPIVELSLITRYFSIYRLDRILAKNNMEGNILDDNINYYLFSLKIIIRNHIHFLLFFNG